MNQIQNRGPDPEEITINVKVIVQTSQMSFTLRTDSFVPFNIFQQFVKEDIFAQKDERKYDGMLAFQFGDLTISENETKSLKELGFVDNSQLIVGLMIKFNYKGESHKYNFRILTKNNTFSFDLQCPLNIQSQDLEFLLKKRIFELSGLQAKKDYVDQLIFKTQSKFCPSNMQADDIESLMIANTTIEVILQQIGKA